jgi:ABC-type amino acid transport substrate-binding protein
MALNARAAQPKHFDIVYPQIQPGGDVHAAFALAVLDLAMKAANADYTVRQAKVVMERGRALAELVNGDTIDLHWTSMDEQAERGLNVVHIPIHRGLIGYRVFIIRKDRQPDFDRINSLDDLKALTAGQGLGWIDTEIMRRAGLNVQTSTYETLFTMTQGGRVDYFPRGVIEAFAELDARKHVVPDLVVENRLLLLYRSDFLFYVARGQKELAATIEQGFTAAYRDGSYMKLFNSHPYIQNPLRQANLAGRKIIGLDNPYLSEADRRIPDEYWMH